MSTAHSHRLIHIRVPKTGSTSFTAIGKLGEGGDSARVAHKPGGVVTRALGDAAVGKLDEGICGAHKPGGFGAGGGVGSLASVW